MKLYKLLEGVKAWSSVTNEDIEITGISIDSRTCKKGDIFIALNGVKNRGDDYISQAIANGAKAIVSQNTSDRDGEIIVQDAREAYALICKNFYDRACDKLKIIGVTGTNGKTTTATLIADILKGCKKNVGLIGTLGVSYDDNAYDTGFTTPDPHILHKCFKEMLDDGVEYVVMEASAHAIALKKLSGIKFEIGVLTNITQDHLDFFKDMDRYAYTKLSFFNKDNMKCGLINSDDERARRLLDTANLPIISYGLDNPSDIFAINIDSSFDGTSFVCNCLDNIVPIKTNLVGRYNVSNALAAIGVCNAIGVNINQIAFNLRYISPVEGRFNIIKHKNFNIVVDYAHTSDGIENILKSAKPLTKGRLIALFGCGGDRDKLKRPIMGRVASEIADKLWLTSDNPRSEEPLGIIKEIEKGVPSKMDYEVCENRALAIEKALDDCKEGDTLVILGKGAEKYQEIKGEKVPYNDFDEVYKYFRKHITLKRSNDESE